MSKKKSVPVGPSSIDRALGGMMPEAGSIDVESLRKAEEMHRTLRSSMQTKDTMEIGASSGSSSARRIHQKDQGITLSKLYNTLGMDSLRRHPRLALECLQRALLVAPK